MQPPITIPPHLIYTHRSAPKDTPTEDLLSAAGPALTNFILAYAGTTLRPEYMIDHPKLGPLGLHEIEEPDGVASTHFTYPKLRRRKLIPVFNDDCGNLYLAHTKPPHPVQYLDHESGKRYRVAKSLQALFDTHIIRDESEPDPHAKPSTLGWVDPDFKPEF